MEVDVLIGVVGFSPPLHVTEYIEYDPPFSARQDHLVGTHVPSVIELEEDGLCLGTVRLFHVDSQLGPCQHLKLRDIAHTEVETTTCGWREPRNISTGAYNTQECLQPAYY